LCATPSASSTRRLPISQSLCCSSRISAVGRTRIKSYCGELSKRRPGIASQHIFTCYKDTRGYATRSSGWEANRFRHTGHHRLQPVVFQLHNYNKTKHTDTTGFSRWSFNFLATSTQHPSKVARVIAPKLNLHRLSRWCL